MDFFDNKIYIKVSDNACLKSPTSSKLGVQILKGGIDLIDDLGFEDFTFKKLATHISSTEASIYRYFDCKHQLLTYLVYWYWGWQEYRMHIQLMNIDDPIIRLKRAIKILTEKIEEDSTFSEINEVKLNRIVISESSKIYLNRKVRQDNKLGLFSQYKDVVQRVGDIILEINKDFKYPHMLVSTIIEGANHQRFFAENIPSLTDVIEGEDAVTNFYQELVFNEIK